MAGPANNEWGTESITATKLNDTTFGSGTTSERTAITANWDLQRPFFDTDEGVWYRNSGSYGSVTWSKMTFTEILNKQTVPSFTELDDTDNQIWNETVFDGNIFRYNNNITSIDETIKPMRYFTPIGNISTLDKMPIGTSLVLDEDFTQYTSNANIENLWIVPDSTVGFTPDYINNQMTIDTDNITSTNNIHAWTLDLGGYLADTFVARAHCQITSWSQVSAGNLYSGLHFGSASGSNSTQAMYGFTVLNDDINIDYSLSHNASGSLRTRSQQFADTPSAEEVYLQFRKTSSTSLSIDLYHTGGYGTPAETETFTVTNFTNLRWIHFWGYRLSSEAGGALNWRLHDIQLKNGVTTW